MLLLDPEADGAVLRGRLRVGGRRGGRGGTVAFDVSVTVGRSADDEGGIQPVCCAVSCRMLRAQRFRLVLEVSGGARGKSPATPALGGDVPRELRGSCGAGRRGD